MTRRRLDRELVRRGLSPSRQESQRLISERLVLVNGSFAAKSASMVAPSDQIAVQASGPRYVSRSGNKLAQALDDFRIDPAGWRCLDVGSSTGGFTDCLLQRGAAAVTAVDVGTHQLHERIRSNARVTALEQTDIRSLSERHPTERDFDVAVVDVSFISLRHVIPSVVPLLSVDGLVLPLIKPQFEAGRQEAARGRGVIAEPDIWRRTVTDVIDGAAELGMKLGGIVACSTRGTKGNVEFMAVLARNGPTISERDGLIDRAVHLAAGSSPGSSDGV